MAPAASSAERRACPRGHRHASFGRRDPGRSHARRKACAARWPPARSRGDGRPPWTSACSTRRMTLHPAARWPRHLPRARRRFRRALRAARRRRPPAPRARASEGERSARDRRAARPPGGAPPHRGHARSRAMRASARGRAPTACRHTPRRGGRTREGRSAQRPRLFRGEVAALGLAGLRAAGEGASRSSRSWNATPTRGIARQALGPRRGAARAASAAVAHRVLPVLRS